MDPLSPLHHYLESRAQVICDLGFEALPQLKTFADLLWTSNDELNLFSRKMKIEEFVDNHLIDCLLPLKHFPKEVQSVADFGSGGGLPGVIFALQYPDKEFHLFEKSPKKQVFLRKCKALAPNIVIAGEITAAALKDVQLITARAFKPIDVILEISREHYLGGGRYFLLKGRKDKINEELELATRKQKSLHSEVVALESPVLEVERHLVLL